MKKILPVLLIIFGIIILALFYLVRSPQTSVGDNLKTVSIAANIANKITNFVSPKTSTPSASPSQVELINQNPKITVSINSNDKLNKFIADQLPDVKKLTIIISGDPFVVGINEYWTDSVNKSKTFFGGTSVNSDKNNYSINLAIDINAVKNANWSEETATIYLEYKLYYAVINLKQNPTITPKDDTNNYYDEITKLYSQNLFRINYAK